MQNNERLKLLVSVAKLYYIENMTQNDIANKLGVSRPLISKYLQEAKNIGVVKIEVNDISNSNEDEEIVAKICKKYNLRRFYVIPASTNKDLNDQMFVDAITSFLNDNYIDNSTIGLGWGSVIGSVIASYETRKANQKLLGKIMPIISNAPISYRNYHTNELVRMFAEKSGLKAEYLYMPVICANREERELFINTPQTVRMFEKYKNLDYVITQIRNFPSVPDLATEARFEKKLQESHAVGMVLGYYFDINGNIITSSHDHTIQIPIEDIKNTPRSIAIVNARVNSSAVIGALRSGVFNTFIISETVVDELLTKEFLDNL